MKRRPAWFLLVPLLLASEVALAAPGLSVEQAVARAVARAPELAALRESEAAARAKIDQARSAYLPRATVDVSYSAHWPKNELPISFDALPFKIPVGEIDDYHRFSVGAGAALRVLDFTRGPRVDAARSNLASEQARGKESAASLAFQVRATFLAGLLARDLRQIAKSSLELALAEEKRALLRVEVGTGSQLALAQARVRAAGLRAQLRQAESELDRQRRLLASLLGIRAEQLPELEGQLDALAGPVAERPLAETPALERLRSARAASEATARSSARGIIPTLGLSARAEYQYPHALKVEWGPLVQGGVVLSWELYDGGLRGAQAAEARAQARALEQQAQATEQSLRRRLIDVEARIRAAQADLTSARETLEQNEVYLRVARAAVAAGTGTQLDVHNAELGVDRARVAVQQALLAKALARAEALMVHGVVEEHGAAPRTLGGGGELPRPAPGAAPRTAAGGGGELPRPRSAGAAQAGRSRGPAATFTTAGAQR